MKKEEANVLKYTIRGDAWDDLMLPSGQNLHLLRTLASV